MFVAHFSVLPRLQRITLACFLAITLAACERSSNSDASFPTIKMSGPIMGTQFSISVVDDRAGLTDETSQKTLENQIVSRLNVINQSMSHYLSDSEIKRIEAAPADEWVSLSRDLEVVLREAQRLYQLSGGAFDVTLAPVIDAWGFGPSGNTDRLPSDRDLVEFKARVGTDKLELSDGKVKKERADLAFNLSALAKGYAVDEIGALLEAQGYNRYLVDIGGELRGKGLNARNIAWQVAIEEPHVTGGIHRVISLRDEAIATSGDYRNFVEIDGQRFSHTIDSSTFKPALHRLASISVLHESAMTADALATSIMSLGEERGLAFARSLDLSFIALIREESTLATQMSDDIAQSLTR